MRGTVLSIVVFMLGAQAALAQATFKLIVPNIPRESPTDAGVRQRVERIIGREVRFRFEYEVFIKDLAGLGRQAVPFILDAVHHDVSDRYVTEALLRIGGQDVRKWLYGVIGDADTNFRQAFLSGVPSLVHVHPSVRKELVRFLHDKSSEVRILAVQKFHTLVPAEQMLTRCRDMNRDVVRVAIETVSSRWLFLDHRDRELTNLAKFLGILEMHERDDEWRVGRGFTKALQKERIASTKRGRQLWRRAAKLPWFRTDAAGLTEKNLVDFREAMRGPGAIAKDVLTKTLRTMKPAAGAELLLVLADDSDASIRLAACDAGLTLLDPELASAFVRFLKDPDPKIRARAKTLLQQTAFYTDQQARWGHPKRL
jgi:hypothetical protein